MNKRVRQIWLDGVMSSVAVAMTAALCSRCEGRSALRPINAISHIVWGRHAAKQNGGTIRYTGTGLLLNLVACTFWTTCYHLSRRAVSKPNSSVTTALVGTGTTALAYITDYYVVPRRFTPGFELCLPSRSFPWLYGALALGILLPDLARQGVRGRS